MELWKQMGFLDEQGNMKPEIISGLKTIPQGASTSIWAATNPALDDIGGVYCEDADIAELLSSNPSTKTNAGLHQNGVQEYSLDANNAKNLWTLTEELSGIKFSIN
jgi:hypothetical protein